MTPSKIDPVKAAQKNKSEACSVIVLARDRFSPTEKCIAAIISNTSEYSELIVVLGGASSVIQRRLTSAFGNKARFLFEPSFLNPAQARNVGLKACRTRLAAFVDNDVIVERGWLESMILCHQETGAAMVVPLILEKGRVIHTAGNDLYITYKNGMAYGSKVLRHYKQQFFESSNLKRTLTDYGELHCQLVDARIALELGVYDEKIMEVGECDSGLTWSKAGHQMWFEPAAVVTYDVPYRIYAVEDIRLFAWRWDMRTIRAGYEHFRQKWNLDISECNRFRDFLLLINSSLGLLPRIFPSRPALMIDHFLKRSRRLVERSLTLVTRLKAHIYGYFEWK